ncbi:MAG: Ig-like domain-containing protein, partial [Ignavibacteria bacterium]|nr:Ig-like domain-containing protein [Ignavibacteria bacterium]
MKRTPFIPFEIPYYRQIRFKQRRNDYRPVRVYKKYKTFVIDIVRPKDICDDPIFLKVHKEVVKSLSEKRINKEQFFTTESISKHPIKLLSKIGSSFLIKCVLQILLLLYVLSDFSFHPLAISVLTFILSILYERYKNKNLAFLNPNFAFLAFLFFGKIGFAQTISGTYKSALDGTPISNVTVKYTTSGKSFYTKTDYNGRYSLTVTSVKTDESLIRDFQVSISPNPGNKQALYIYTPVEKEVDVTRYNILGQVINSYENIKLRKGQNEILIEGRNIHGAKISEGIYITVISEKGKALSIIKSIHNKNIPEPLIGRMNLNEKYVEQQRKTSSTGTIEFIDSTNKYVKYTDNLTTIGDTVYNVEGVPDKELENKFVSNGDSIKSLINLYKHFGTNRQKILGKARVFFNKNNGPLWNLEQIITEINSVGEIAEETIEEYTGTDTYIKFEYVNSDTGKTRYDDTAIEVLERTSDGRIKKAKVYMNTTNNMNKNTAQAQALKSVM